MNINDILSFLEKKGVKYSVVRKHDDEITGFSSIFHYKEKTMTFIVPERRFEDYEHLFQGKLIHFIIIGEEEKDNEVFYSVIRVKNPRAVFFLLLDEMMSKDRDENITLISSNPDVYNKTSYISKNAQIGNNVKIGVGCVIEGNVVIGDNTEIHHNVVIRNQTKIGRNCTIHSGVIIGEYGFGYVKDDNGQAVMLKHYGGVNIEDDVHIGDNCIIIRGAIDDTIIHKGVKLNTMVHIAHNDEIGERTLVTSPCHVCGSVSVGKDCHIAGSIIRNQRSVGNNAVVGLGSVVVKDVEAFDTVVGNPAKSMEK